MASSPPPAMIDRASGATPALQAAMDRAALDEPTRLDVIAWLGEQLADERYAQLDRAGHDPADRIPLARVLLDVPIARSPVENREGAHPAKTLLLALCTGDQGLFEAMPGPDDMAAGVVGPARAHAVRSRENVTPHENVTSGVVLVGGPGQGKSTITQSLSAVHHAALLTPHVELLDGAARDALASIHTAQLRAPAGPQAPPPLPRPDRPRLPLRISLPDAAVWLLEKRERGSSPGPALLRFIAERAAKRQIRVETLIALLACSDWLLILDGLDEVPASEARDRVLSEARLLLDALHVARPGGLVVATTRPQGYGGELASWAEVQTWYLLPLSTAEAQQYARQLVAARYETPRGDRILARLYEASGTAATARLLRSPLQVTILVALIARIGRAPGERWSLFSEYYRIIYEREMERDHPAAELLRRYRALIDRIHAHVGLLLQAETEQAAGTDATMTTARLRDVMHAVFADQGMDAARRQPVVEGLLAAITERLVLLVERHEGHIGFEIRPLQELMAAWALAQKEALSEARLSRVARSDAFREVVLFLASKAFADLSDVRDVLVDRVLPALNEDPDEPMSPALLRGSVLAVDVLEDGAALSQPKYVEKLAAVAVRLVDLPISPLLPRLARACMADADGAAAGAPVLLGAIKAKLDAEGAPEERLSAWALLISLVDEGDAEARLLADKRWAGDEAFRNEILSLRRGSRTSRTGWLSQVVFAHARQFHPNIFFAFHGFEQVSPLIALRAAYGGRRTIDVPLGMEETTVTLRLQWVSIDQPPAGLQALAALEPGTPEWRPVVASARFLLAPDKESLAAALEYVASGPVSASLQIPLHALPWPLAACLVAADDADELKKLAHRARVGELGDKAAWDRAEERCEELTWVATGAIATSASLAWPAQGDLEGSLLPIAAADKLHWYGGDTDGLTADERLEPLLSCLRSSFLPQFIKTPIADIGMNLLLVFAERKTEAPLSVEDMRLLWSLNHTHRLEALSPVVSLTHPTDQWLNLLDDIGRSGSFEIQSLALRNLPEIIADGFEENLGKTGLLHLLKSMMVVGQSRAVNPELLAIAGYTNPRDRDAALLIKVALGAVSEAEAEAAGPALVAATGNDYFPAAHLCQIAIKQTIDPTIQHALFRGLLQALPPKAWARRSDMIIAARKLLGKAPTGLDDPAVWDALQLPMPRPERRSQSDRAPASPVERRPVLIDEITLRNFRGIEELRIAPAPPQNGHGQWIVLLGKNGLGKTSVLRALALSLFDIDEPVRRPLPPTAYKSAWRRLGTPEEQPSFVHVKLRGNDHGVEIRPRADLLAPEQLAPIARPPNEMVFAYGVRRRYLVSDVKRAVVMDLYTLVPSLFEEGADLLPLEESLVPLEAAWHTRPDSVEGRLHVELRAALTRLLRVQHIELRGQDLWVQGPGIGDVPLKELSDGYLTLAAWVVDLVVRWWHQAKRWKIEPTGPVLESMTGLVLVDEIDLFLHPDWQRSVVRTLKELFPRMSFVVTTHNPLAILGARAAEIWILRREEGGAIHAEQREQEPFRLTGSDLYDFYFGIESALPDELGQMLHRYRQLAGDPFRNSTEDTEARRLLERLRAEDLDPGWEPVPLEEVPPLPEGLS